VHTGSAWRKVAISIHQVQLELINPSPINAKTRRDFHIATGSLQSGDSVGLAAALFAFEMKLRIAGGWNEKGLRFSNISATLLYW
jgi:hypothetical protein